MNTQRDLLKRLLKLYPIKLVKDYFSLKGIFEDLSDEVIKKNKPKNIFDFATAHMNYTRQHIYIFDLKPPFNQHAFNAAAFPLDIHSNATQDGDYVIQCFPLVDFDVKIINPYDEDNISFHQPIKIWIRSKHLILQVTTLEKNLSHYFGIGRKVVDSTRNNGEDVSINLIIDFFSDKHTLSTCDLHAGVKHIWESFKIDSKYVKSKNSRGTATLAMDEEFTVRQEYPDKYEEIIKTPLLKTLFKYKEKDDLWCDHFSIDPKNGEISIATFPDNLKQVENVINEIIKHNQ